MADTLTWDLLARAGRIDRLSFRVPGTMKTEKVECVILTKADVQGLATRASSTEPAPRRAGASEAQEELLEHVETLQQLLACFRSWEPQVRVLGNVRAADAAAAVLSVLGLCGAHAAPMSAAGNPNA